MDCFKNNTELVMVNYQGNKNIYNKKYQFNNILQTSSIFSIWENRIGNTTSFANMFANMALITLGCLSIIVLLFVGNIITLELFYRKREIGYLQIFNVSKQRIRYIIITEYLFKVLKSLLVAIIIFYVAVFFINKFLYMKFLLNPIVIIVIILLIIIYTVSLIYFPLRK